MLVVVDSADDAGVAVEGGADRIVFRVPKRDDGFDAHVLRGIRMAVKGRRPVSLWMAAKPTEAEWIALNEASLADEVHIPFDGSCEATPAWKGASGRWIAVLPSDEASHESLLDLAAARGFSGAIVGEGVQPKRLLHAMTIGHLQQRVQWGRARGLSVSLAGVLEAPDIPRLLAIEPDQLVFDSTVRREGLANGPLNPERLRFVRDLIPTDESAAGPAFDQKVERDHIFVRDWTIPVHIGAYEHERVAQRVRFSVDVEVLRIATRVSDFRQVVTYDLITDAISRFTVDHVELVETLAENIAGAILAHPRAVHVDITVEKLDLGPGSLGCRISRRRGERL